MREEWFAAAGRAAIFREIPPESIRALVACVCPEIREYKAGAEIAAAGEPVTGLGVVLAGRTSVHKLRPSGEQVRMGLFGPGETFGEIVVFAAESRWPATVAAEEDSSVMFLPAGRILGFCAQRCEAHTRLVLNLLRSLSDRALMLNRRIDYLVAGSIRAKAAMYLLEQCREADRESRDADRGDMRQGHSISAPVIKPSASGSGGRDSRLITLPMNRNQLAEFLNVPRPSLSRELRSMKEDGLIDYHREIVRILDQKRLREAADGL